MMEKLLDTEAILWRDPSFFGEERLVQAALPFLHRLIDELLVLSILPINREERRALVILRQLRNLPGWVMPQWEAGFTALQQLHQFFERNSAQQAFDENQDVWTSWLFAFTFFELAESKRQDVHVAFLTQLTHLWN
ncbi:MAG: hypothetical protein QNK62_05055 [Cryomorphaceae bacterium]